MSDFKQYSKKRTFEIITIVIAVLVMVFGVPWALKEVSANANVFTVKPVLPSNQVEGVENYISVLSPNEAYSSTLEFEVTNHGEETIEIQAKALNAITSPTGSIQYVSGSEIEKAKISSDEYIFSDYVPELESIKVPAKQAVLVKIPVNIPIVNGEILGGISFTTLAEQQQSTNEEIEIIVNNELNTIVAVQVNFGEVNTKVDFELGIPYFEQQPSMYTIQLPISYTGNKVQANSTFTYVVLDSEQNSIFEGVTDLTLSPKSEFYLSIPWRSDTLDLKEEYTLMGTVATADGEMYPFNKVFSGKTEPIMSANTSTEVTVENEGSGLITYLIYTAIALVVIGIVVFVMYRRRK